MLPDMAERDCSRSSKDIALAKRAGKVVMTILMSAYKFPEVRWGHCIVIRPGVTRMGYYESTP